MIFSTVFTFWPKKLIEYTGFALAVQIWQALSMLSIDEVKHIARLARLGLKESEAEKFVRQLNSIFEYIVILNEVNTDKVEATAQVTGLQNVTRKDEVRKFCAKDELLACTELPVENGQIRVKPVITF